MLHADGMDIHEAGTTYPPGPEFWAMHTALDMCGKCLERKKAQTLMSDPLRGLYELQLAILASCRPFLEPAGVRQTNKVFDASTVDDMLARAAATSLRYGDAEDGCVCVRAHSRFHVSNKT